MISKSDQLPDGDESLENALPRLAAEGKLAVAARDAIERQAAKGLAVTFLRGERIIVRYPDGREDVIATLAAPTDWTPRHTIKTQK